jgi:uncharacterized protein YkwD
VALAATAVVVVVAVVAVHIASGAPRPTASGAPRPTGPTATSIRPTAARTATPSPTTSRAARTAAAPTIPAAGPSPAATAPPVSAAAGAVLALINQARAQTSLPAYTISTGLELSSSRHNQLMADGCGLSHQCPDEPALGARETAAGVDWTAAGENIGEGGPVADTSVAITQMAVALTQDMLNEKPPDDGHRLNILSSTFTHIGIAVQESADGTVWMTQDFSN